ncbi:hypothetical protein MGM1_4470 [Candidatus Malacoplasma girerdii]|uniref:Uncharacterized protein n=1 Tax=Candidatus Malacoplasma girerdii TaxID=1318617 RepID=A0A097ST95_9BACT|nr:hypothetical protein MGM1_4470 [Candidatus Malacoplasma girerdii]ASJ89327.1 MAG: hypothetical protein B1217_0444 [Candidatus Malacoplasma girerdii]
MSYQGLDKLIVDNGVFNNTPIESFKTIHGLVSKTDTDKQKNYYEQQYVALFNKKFAVNTRLE